LRQLQERTDVIPPILAPAFHQFPDRFADLSDVIETINRIGPHTPGSPLLPHRLSLPVTFMVYFSPTQVTLVSNPTENPT